ncbi:monosaccharide-sensing protein 2-like [Amaranthus tricolor]|uniref:monosaccharide-sensing protein 2-like n=1 Tax=Amaranthus tricolor TaxID=29722 RepID=UPI0025870165|nr:monosaccharide-sensing protein 2-like [Amaranthus tricolor]
MRGAVFAAIAATMGNLLQGWDNATIAGAVIYIKREFDLESQPTLEGLIVAMSLIGATVITTFSGPVSDSVGRRPMLIVSSLLYFLGGLVMLWSPNVYVLLMGRLLDGFGVGLAVTLVPVYISETAPPEIRGQLNTLPQFTGSGGMFLSYCMVFGMSLMEAPRWRLMLGVLSIPSLLYLALMVFYLPESPRWLVSKGKMNEAKKVLQRLRAREDVNGEMALLVEGLGTGENTSIEEYLIGPSNDEEATADKDQIKLYSAEQGQSWIAKPVKGQSMLGMASRYGSMAQQGGGSMANMMDPLVTLFGSVHEKLPQSGSMRSAIFPNFGSMFNAAADENDKHENWEDESRDEDSSSDVGRDDSDDNLNSPLLSPHAPGAVPPSSGSTLNLRHPSNLMQSGELLNSTGIGGGWQLAYKKATDGKGELQRVYLHQEGGMGSMRGSMLGSVLSLPPSEMPEGQLVQAAGLVSQSNLKIKDFKGESPFEGGKIQPSSAVTKGPSWRELFEPGVKRALVVGMGLQILQQFSGINGVLYYTPQILQQAGVDVLLSNMGIGSDSASLLISGLTTLLMLPSIGIAMRLMDISGRRFLLLNTLPVLLGSLIILVLSNVINMGTVLHATLSTVSVVVYFCCFVMGFGPIPNILCSEIFPTRVRGLCIAICSLTFWFGDIIVTYSLPALLSSIGLAGVFGIYAIVCSIAWFFVYFKVPETKGMPLEVISEFFNVGARQAEAEKDM